MKQNLKAHISTVWVDNIIDPTISNFFLLQMVVMRIPYVVGTRRFNLTIFPYTIRENAGERQYFQLGCGQIHVYLAEESI